MSGILVACIIIVAMCSVGCAVRLATASTLADRLLALDVLLITIAVGVALESARTGTGAFLDLLVLVALIAFIGTVSGARFIEQRDTP